MRTFLIALLLSAVAIGLTATGITFGQESDTTLPTLPTADTGTVPVNPTVSVTEPTALPPETEVPLDPTLPPDHVPPTESTSPTPDPTPWTWQHQTQNQHGTVTNSHDWMRSQDGNNYSYQHSVTRPNGSHTQLREYSMTEEGYQLMRQQRFYKPDGTLLREHSMSVNGTDPYNYQRQMTHTFRDGRTMEKTFARSYDGTTGTMERSFIGPNGQVRQFERPWAPDDLANGEASTTDPIDVPVPQEPTLPTTDQAVVEMPTIVDPLAPTSEPTNESLLSRLNPFKKRSSKRSTGSSSTARRSGFTIGSFGRSRRMDAMSPGQTRKASGLTNASQVRSMKTKMKQTGPAAHATANRPSTVGKQR